MNKYAQFLGGGIHPDRARLKSLHEHAAEATAGEKTGDFPLVGIYDTNQHPERGDLGMAKEIDGMISLYQEKYHNLNVILTGVIRSIFPHLNNPIIPDADLIWGLYAIWDI